MNEPKYRVAVGDGHSVEKFINALAEKGYVPIMFSGAGSGYACVLMMRREPSSQVGKQ